MNELFLFSVVATLAATTLFLFWRLRSESARTRSDSRDLARLSRELATLREHKELTEAILANVEEGIIVFSETSRPAFANAAATRLLALPSPLAPHLIPGEVRSLVRRTVSSAQRVDEVVDIGSSVGASVRVVAVPLNDHRGVLAVLQDVSSEQRTQRMRRQFVAHASHELKTPVASIQALAEAIVEAVHDDPRASAQFSERLVEESERLARLVRDLLDLSRLEDPVSISTRSIDLGDVAEQELSQAKPLADAKRISLTSHITPGVVVRGDDNQLALMVRNLLDNAVRYTGNDGAVAVEVSRDGDEAVVSVSDTGIGIPVSAQGRVFERFFRVDEGRAREQGGTGLGLAIVKHVADLHGGHVEVSSELGEGSTFIVRIPALPE